VTPEPEPTSVIIRPEPEKVPVKPPRSFRDEAGVKYHLSRDYSGHKSLRDRIRECRNLNELEKVRTLVVVLAQQGQISSSNLRKLDKLGAAQYARLSLIERPTLIVAP